MFDIGGWELGLAAVIALLVIGPKELPAALRTLGRMLSKIRSLSNDFRRYLDDAIRDAELDELKDSVNDLRREGIRRTIGTDFDLESDIDPPEPAARPSGTAKTAETPEVGGAANQAVESHTAVESGVGASDSNGGKGRPGA